MTGVLRYTIVVQHPESLTPVALLAGHPVPEWAEDLVSDEDLEDGDQGSGGDESGIPAKSGKGSGKEAWAEYAASVGVSVDPDASRDDIIAALAAAGQPTG